jgi:hypothetical protein
LVLGHDPKLTGTPRILREIREQEAKATISGEIRRISDRDACDEGVTQPEK